MDLVRRLPLVDVVIQLQTAGGPIDLIVDVRDPLALPLRLVDRSNRVERHRWMAGYVQRVPAQPVLAAAPVKRPAEQEQSNGLQGEPDDFVQWDVVPRSRQLFGSRPALPLGLFNRPLVLTGITDVSIVKRPPSPPQRQ